MLSFAVLAALAAAIPAPDVPQGGGQDGEAVVRAMRARYDGKWYRTFTFRQATTFADGRFETWYEAMEMPGKLRIDVVPVDSGNGTLFRADSIYTIRGGRVAQANPMVHPLLLLGFDVYHLPAEKSIADLRRLGFDLTKTHESTWQGRRAIVVGAAAGDTTSRQFWIDAERLVFVRLVQPTAQGGRSEIQFNKYAPLGEGWVAPEVRFFTNGRQTLLEEYHDMKIGMSFSPELFLPTPWARARWMEQ